MDWRCLTLTWSRLACPAGPNLLQALALVLSGLSLALALVNLAMTLNDPGWPTLALTHIDEASLTLALDGDLAGSGEPRSWLA